MRSMLHVLCFQTALAAPALSADIKSLKLSEGRALITVSGDIAYGDDLKFVDSALGVKEGIIAFNSSGGNLNAALEIGKAIRLKGFVTYVPPGSTCASACALAWLGGGSKLASGRSRIGFHAAYTEQNGEKTPTGIGNALVGAYLSQLGYSQSTIVFVTAASPDSIEWLGFDAAQKVGIEVKKWEIDDNATKPQVMGSPSPPASPAPQASAPRTWTSYGEWIQIYSRPTLSEALVLAQAYEPTFKNTVVFQYTNGWYAVLIGPYPVGIGSQQRDYLKATGKVPGDSFITRGERFGQLSYGRITR
ncbi:COG3904 family protein [Alsobacter sp. SYSU BS001988]